MEFTLMPYTLKNSRIILIGSRIRKKRISKGWTMMDLAFEAGVDYRQLGRIERGENNFTIISLLRITDALGCHIRDVIK
jgi:transcriptional regulator with XRE-family HTH domain